MTLKAVKRNQGPSAVDLVAFTERYGLVLESVGRRVHAMVARGVKYVPTEEVAHWVENALPTLATKTWGRGLKHWRIMTMISNARFLGAFEELDIRGVRGKGLTTVVRPRGKRRLRLVKGGKR